MDNKEELLNRIKVLEHENKVLQNTINELQQEKHNLNSFFTPNIDLHSYVVGDIYSKFWSQPANSLWSQIEQKSWLPTPRVNFPLFASDGDYCSGFMASECSPEYEEENEELKKKVGELKKKIEKLEQKLEEQKSPLVYVVEAIKESARYDSPSAAYELFRKLDYIFKNCDQWNENVTELKGFLLREKNRALLPPPPSMNYPTDQQLAEAISSICGEGKVLNDYQSWLGVCCYVCAHCGYPMDLKMCCERLKQLPYRKELYREVKYENIRMFSNWNFVRVGYDQWTTMKINDQERTLFIKCRDTAVALENALNNAQR